MKQTECIITADFGRAIFVTFADEGSRDPTPEEVWEYLRACKHWGEEVYSPLEWSLVEEAAARIIGDEVY
jgi:hypothetical protein